MLVKELIQVAVPWGGGNYSRDWDETFSRRTNREVVEVYMRISSKNCQPAGKEPTAAERMPL